MILQTVSFISLADINASNILIIFLNYIKINSEWNLNSTMKSVARNDPIIIFFKLIGIYSQTETSDWSWPNPLRREWYCFG